MRPLTVRLPEALVAEIEAESRIGNVSKSDVVRARLSGAARSPRDRGSRFAAIADMVGPVGGLPADLSARRKPYLQRTEYGGTHHR